MDIRKTDSKGRLTGFPPNTPFFVTGPIEKAYRIREVPVVDEIPEGYELAEISAAKEQVYDLLYAQGLDPEENDLIQISDRVVEAFLRVGFTAN